MVTLREPFTQLQVCQSIKPVMAPALLRSCTSKSQRFTSLDFNFNFSLPQWSKCSFCDSKYPLFPYRLIPNASRQLLIDVIPFKVDLC